MIENPKLFRRVVAALKEDYRRWWDCQNTRLALGGHCAQAAHALLPFVKGGKVVCGMYHGPIEVYSGGPWWQFSPEFRYGYHRHCWVETEKDIYDPTWWAFIKGKPLGVYIFPKPDARYVPNV